MSDTLAVGQKLVELCNEGKYLDAIDTLYSDDIVSIEAVDAHDDMPREMTGIEAVRGKTQWWLDNHEVHGGSIDGPFPFEDRFITIMNIDITPQCGPMTGQRMQMSEACHYTVKDGKIIREEFFYHMGE